ncbi:hypothetical protein AB0C96_17270 [Streptomyces sp. NPDC048506]|uniref:hypothetical protein n=1 Tax=Streptomyces sp. NPDC048506 TaxID=3155028 RepID=UPI003422A995
MLFDFSGTLFQIGTYADRIRAALPHPVDEAAMDRILGGLEAGLSDPEVVEAQRARDVSSSAHRHAFTTWYASVPELAPVAEVLYEQLKAPAHWVPYADARARTAGWTPYCGWWGSPAPTPVPRSRRRRTAGPAPRGRHPPGGDPARCGPSAAAAPDRTVRSGQTAGTGKVGYSTPETCWTTRITWHE